MAHFSLNKIGLLRFNECTFIELFNEDIWLAPRCRRQLHVYKRRLFSSIANSKKPLYLVIQLLHLISQSQIIGHCASRIVLSRSLGYCDADGNCYYSLSKCKFHRTLKQNSILCQFISNVLEYRWILDWIWVFNYNCLYCISISC